MIQLEMIAIIKENDALPEVVTEVSATHELKEEAHWLSHGTHLRAVSYFCCWKKNNSLKSNMITMTKGMRLLGFLELNQEHAMERFAGYFGMTTVLHGSYM